MCCFVICAGPSFTIPSCTCVETLTFISSAFFFFFLSGFGVHLCCTVEVGSWMYASLGVVTWHVQQCQQKQHLTTCSWLHCNLQPMQRGWYSCSILQPFPHTDGCLWIHHLLSVFLQCASERLSLEARAREPGAALFWSLSVLWSRGAGPYRLNPGAHGLGSWCSCEAV